MATNDIDYRKLGQRVRNAREKKGLKQADVAYLADITATHMSHIETGNTKPALPTLMKIANVLSTTVDPLVYDSLEASNYIYNQEIQELITDCTPSELAVIREFISLLLKTLREQS